MERANFGGQTVKNSWAISMRIRDTEWANSNGVTAVNMRGSGPVANSTGAAYIEMGRGRSAEANG